MSASRRLQPALDLQRLDPAAQVGDAQPRQLGDADGRLARTSAEAHRARHRVQPGAAAGRAGVVADVLRVRPRQRSVRGRRCRRPARNRPAPCAARVSAAHRCRRSPGTSHACCCRRTAAGRARHNWCCRPGRRAGREDLHRPMPAVGAPASIAARRPSSALSTCTTPLPCSSAAARPRAGPPRGRATHPGSAPAARWCAP
jgi:hypothetical protein